LYIGLPYETNCRVAARCGVRSLLFQAPGETGLTPLRATLTQVQPSFNDVIQVEIDGLRNDKGQQFMAGRMTITRDQAKAQIANYNFLKVPAKVQDTANAAVLVASDRARMITGTVLNATAGAALDM
jgi:hypothetical protein